jgi:hypothetical protein
MLKFVGISTFTAQAHIHYTLYRSSSQVSVLPPQLKSGLQLEIHSGHQLEIHSGHQLEIHLEILSELHLLEILSGLLSGVLPVPV